ncbi:MAG: hypothetical protein ACREHD_02325 [Pirellulales bacterium]
MPRLTHALLAAAFLVATETAAQDTTIMTDGTTRVSLRVQLERGLRAMRPVEFQFLRQVLKQVKAGTLPKDLVEQAFLWAQRQPRYRVQYFEKALKALARRNQITFTTKVSSFDPGFNTPVR